MRTSILRAHIIRPLFAATLALAFTLSCSLFQDKDGNGDKSGPVCTNVRNALGLDNLDIEVLTGQCYDGSILINRVTCETLIPGEIFRYEENSKCPPNANKECPATLIIGATLHEYTVTVLCP